MPQVLDSNKTSVVTTANSHATLGFTIFYLAVVLVPIALKLLGLTRVAAWPWQKVTFCLWGPWLLLVVIGVLTSLATLLLRQVNRRRAH